MAPYKIQLATEVIPRLQDLIKRTIRPRNCVGTSWIIMASPVSTENEFALINTQTGEVHREKKKQIRLWLEEGVLELS